MVLKNETRKAVNTGFRNRAVTAKETHNFLKAGGYDSLQDYFAKQRAIAKEDACLEWRFGIKDSGYGVIRVDGVLYLTHRLSLSMKLGRLLNKHEVACHACDNPICFNPHHLFVGSASDNMRDMTIKGRQKGFTNVSPKTRGYMRDMFMLGFCRPIIAEIFNVTDGVVRKVTNDIDPAYYQKISEQYIEEELKNEKQRNQIG